MNILFVTDLYPHPYSGGVERVVSRLSEIFTTQLQHKCFLAYVYKDPNTEINKSNYFSENIILSDINKNEFDEFVISNRIDVVLSHLCIKETIRTMLPIVHTGCKNNNIRHYFEFHSMPGFERQKINLSFIFYRLILKINMVDNIKLLFSQFFLRILPDHIIDKYIEKKYLLPVKYSDKVITLSNSFNEQYINIINDLRENKEFYYVSIPNPLSYIDIKVDFNNKKKQLLVVCRLDEYPKRISLILKIWRQIENDSRFNDWNLVIVGDGEDRPVYESITKRLKLKRLSFEGRQKPNRYYEESSIFLMTSSFEGFGVTLIEAQQNGVVPIAFDSYSAIHDIIDDNKTGLIISNNDLESYTQRLKELMLDDEARERIARQAIKSVQKFNIDNTIKSWKQLLDAK